MSALDWFNSPCVVYDTRGASDRAEERCDAPVASLLELFNASFTAPRRSSNSVSFKLEKGSMSGGGEDEDDALGLGAATLTHSPGFVIVVICSGPDGAQMVLTSI